MTPYIPNFHSRGVTVTYLSLPLPDVPEANISQHFEQATSFIDEIAKDEPVLVHCVVGASRSVSVVLAYLMKKNNWDVQTALSHVHNLRSVADPNEGFLKQLHEYAKLIETEK
jgi:protein-tyrosine phosphatase